VRRLPFEVSEVAGGEGDSPTIELSEQPLTDSKGVVCGSSLINLKFGRWFRKKLKNEEARYSKTEFERLVESAIQAFEWTKRDFTGTEMENLYCEVRGLKKSRDGRFAVGFVSFSRLVSNSPRYRSLT
jgi:hypothetical protein